MAQYLIHKVTQLLLLVRLVLIVQAVIVGVNTAKDNTTDDEITAGLDNVNAYGVTSGIYSETGNQAYATSSNIGGIAGVNSGTLHDAYNESIVKGLSNVGGIAGTNSGEISLIVNGASVTAEGDYTGGLVGSTLVIYLMVEIME